MNSDAEKIMQYAGQYSDPPEKIRVGCRGLLLRDNKILLSYEKNTGVYMTPGGGVESGETLEECCKRELCEETGYDVEPEKHLFEFNEYFHETLFVNNYFLCKIKGKGERSLTDIEVEHGLVPQWLEINKVLEIFGNYEKYKEENEGVFSLYLREFTVITKLINMK